MSSEASSDALKCTQCGGELHPDEGQIFLTCPFCSATVYLDKSQVVFHWYLAPTLDEGEARAALARWMSGSQTIKDLDKKAQLTGTNFEYFPVWLVKRKVTAGRDEVILQPAAATSVSELRNLKLPAGDLRKYEPSLDAQALVPSVPLATAESWLLEANGTSGQIVERSLVHIPIYSFKYNYNSAPYTAIVEAGTGGVFANIFPAKAEMPFRLVGAITAAVFLCLATFPLIGAATNNPEGMWIGLAACSGAAVLAAPGLFFAAHWVASKI